MGLYKLGGTRKWPLFAYSRLCSLKIFITGGRKRETSVDGSMVDGQTARSSEELPIFVKFASNILPSPSVCSECSAGKIFLSRLFAANRRENAACNCGTLVKNFT